MINVNSISRIGIGGWNLGDNSNQKFSEISSVRFGIRSGLNLIDTAEMYGSGRSESLIGEAIKEFKRENLYIVSKVLPENCNRDGVFKSCELSLKRLGAEYIDLYLLHWRSSSLNLNEAVACFEELVKMGAISKWGVSNFDVSDMQELVSIPSGNKCFANQVMYNLVSRGVEFDLLPFLKENGILCIAYCPLIQGGHLKRMDYDPWHDPLLTRIAKKYNTNIGAVLLSFVLRQENVVPIFKTSSSEHMKQNLESLYLNISCEDWFLIDEKFPSPSSKMILDIE